MIGSFSELRAQRPAAKRYGPLNAEPESEHFAQKGGGPSVDMEDAAFCCAGKARLAKEARKLNEEGLEKALRGSG